MVGSLSGPDMRQFSVHHYSLHRSLFRREFRDPEAALNDTERRLSDKVVQTHRFQINRNPILGWLSGQSRGLSCIVTAYVPVGPTRDWMEERRLAIESSQY